MPNAAFPFATLPLFSLPVTVDLAAILLFLLKAVVTIVVAVIGVTVGHAGFVTSMMADGDHGQFLFGAGLMTLAAIIGTLIISFAWTFQV
ncbi:MAG: hypothetical protein HGA31_04215 [Candidatus Moranbacteria bacterium]|nr:hypothetical protein [Candidatus Moranbacteria bacterium]